jgi:hypothetical protein
VPQALKNFNLKNQHDAASGKKQKIGEISAFIEIEDYIQKYKIVASKKALMKMLHLDELNWRGSKIWFEYQIQLSRLLNQLIMYRLFFYSAFVRVISNRFRQISYIKWQKTINTSAIIEYNDDIATLNGIKTKEELTKKKEKRDQLVRRAKH